MARTPLSPDALHEASRRCAAVLAEHGSATHTRDLVAASGFSERTFFRYFPTKADCIRPLLDAGNRRFVDGVTRRCADSPDCTFLQVVVDAFIAAYVEGAIAFDHEFLALILGDPPLRRVWLETNYDTAALLIPAAAHMLRLPEDHLDVQLAAATGALLAVSAIRRMVHHGDSAAEAAHAVAHAFARQDLSRPNRAHQQGK